MSHIVLKRLTTPLARRSARAVAFALALSGAAAAQQVSDTAFVPQVSAPAFPAGAGPRLCIDEAHHNFHTMGGRFAPFAALARRDGYAVRPNTRRFTREALADCDLLVVSNAQPSDAPWREYPYPTPSAFTATEIEAVAQWVEQGGRLLLIADHMPLAGAARALAARFGAEFVDGFAMLGSPPGTAADVVEARRGSATIFRRSNGTLAAHAITEGGAPGTQVQRVRSFTGQAFRWNAAAVQPLLILPEDYESLEPRIAWEFTPETPARDVAGWLQGAVRQLGRGRVALFGEAAMFTAQLAGPRRQPIGFNAPQAEQNGQFALNLLHWLSEGLAS